MKPASPITMSRRAVLGGAVGAALAIPRIAIGDPAMPPVLYVSHGSPLHLPGNETRRKELAAWGARLARPRGIVVMTPHFGTRRLEIGHVGAGVALYDLPPRFRSLLPQGLGYATPPNDELARLVEDLLGGPRIVPRGDRDGFDHTTWMPLSCLFPDAGVPVLEIAYPYLPERDLFDLGAKLGPLRREGVVFVASGQITHNLAMPFGEATPPPWAREFDAWAAESVAAHDVDGLVDWRARAPAVDLAHPDDGGHYRVLLVALGVALAGPQTARAIAFPVTGFEATMSKRGIEMCS
ncbi:MAG: DODA-type extradiol aromatic ring-opening family dioxygenase [Polyangiaceae bacterium]